LAALAGDARLTEPPGNDGSPNAPSPVTGQPGVGAQWSGMSGSFMGLMGASSLFLFASISYVVVWATRSADATGIGARVLGRGWHFLHAMTFLTPGRRCSRPRQASYTGWTAVCQYAERGVHTPGQRRRLTTREGHQRDRKADGTAQPEAARRGTADKQGDGQH